MPRLQRFTEPLVGISETTEDVPAEIDLLEIDPQKTGRDFKGPTPRITISASFWFLGGEDRPERDERASILEGHCLRFSAAACVLKLTASLLADDAGAERVLSLQYRWRLARDCPLYLDPGRDGPPAWAIPENCVSDPLWFEGKVWSDYWKIHGWHRERWVRRYSESAIASLAAQASERRPRFLVLGHSQRETQCLSLKHQLLTCEAPRKTI